MERKSREEKRGQRRWTGYLISTKVGKGALELKEYKMIREAVLNHKAYPSMRLLWSAGESESQCSSLQLCVSSDLPN